MRSAVVSWANVHEHNDMWWQHHKLRRALFVGEMGWDIPNNGIAEADQYDSPEAIYVVTHESGRVRAASRLVSCATRFGPWSYMIRDASLGLLPGIPTELIEFPPVQSDTWEATRFTVDPELSRASRTAILEINAKHLAAAARRLGARRLIAMMPPAYARWLSSIGLPTKRIAPAVRDSQENRICVMEMELGSELELYFNLLDF